MRKKFIAHVGYHLPTFDNNYDAMFVIYAETEHEAEELLAKYLSGNIIKDSDFDVSIHLETSCEVIE